MGRRIISGIQRCCSVERSGGKRTDGYRKPKKLSPAVVRELEAAREAMLWLTIPSPDLYEVCEMAEVSAECVLGSREKLEAGTLTQFKTWTFQ